MNPTAAPGRVLGIDPGTRVTGWGVVEHAARGPRLVAYGTLRPSADATPSARLAAIHRGVVAVLSEHAPDALAIEEAFAGRNVRSAIRLAEARAVCMLAGEVAGRPIHELPPALVKKAVCGHGRSGKEGVRQAVLSALGWASDAPTPAYDAADALAVALTALRRLEAPQVALGVPLGRKVARGRRGGRWTLDDVARLGAADERRGEP